MSRTEVRVGVAAVFVVILLMVSFVAEPVRAYSSGSGGTHHFIFEQAKSILQNDGYTSCAEFLDSIEPSSGLSYLQIMIRGSDENDGLVAAREHFMDPMDHHGFFLLTGYQKSAGTLCMERFSQAVTQWKSGNYSQAMYNLGWAAHLVQDLCVPHHAWTTALDWHLGYEEWVDQNKALFAVGSQGIYNFSSFPDLQYYLPRHYSGVNPSAFDWVDYCAHESITQFLRVNSYSDTNITDFADPYIETIHPLPNNLTTVRVITEYGADMMKLHFEKIDMESSLDYIYIYDEHDNVLDVYTGKHEDLWTPWLSTADGYLKIKVATNPSGQSWGYRINEVGYYDLGENVTEATRVLLPLAQRVTAGFIKFFFDKALGLTADLNSDGKVDILDIALIGQAFGSYLGHSRWNPVCDIDGNGAVDIIDMALVAKDYGKVASPL